MDANNCICIIRQKSQSVLDAVETCFTTIGNQFGRLELVLLAEL